MSIRMTLLCDSDDAFDAFGVCSESLASGVDDPAALRAYAAEKGWTRRDGKDRCPRHAAARTRRRLWPPGRWGEAP